MKKQTPKSKEFYKSLKDNPKEIAEWCLEEITEYANLYKLITGKELTIKEK